MSRADCASKFTTLFVAAVAATDPRVWPSSRWTGFDHSVDWMGVLESCHGLLTRVFLKWSRVKGWPLARFYLHPLRPSKTYQLTDSSALEDALRLENQPGVDMAGHAAGGGAPAASSEQEPERAPCGGARKTSADEDRKKEDSIHRYWGARWLHHGNAGAKLTVIRRVLEPLRKIMSKYLDHAGVKHDDRMEYLKVQAAAGRCGDCTDELLPMVAACKQVFEGEFFQDLRALILTEGPWDIITPGLRTRDLRTLAFVMLGEIGCLCHELTVVHSMYPFKMFTLLGGGGGGAADIENDCDDMKDEWSKALIEKYAKTDQGLLNPDLNAELMHAALSIRRETCSIESSHAAIRRSLAALGVQTHPMHIGRLSALRTCQRFRTRRQRLRSGPGRHVIRTTVQQAASKKFPARRRYRGFGGAWRAFVRQQTLGRTGSPDFAELGRAYAALSAEQKSVLMEVGQAATRAARAGNKTPFGGSSRSLEARARKADLARRVQDLSESKRAALLNSAGGIQGDVAVATYDGIIGIASSNPKHLTEMADCRQLERAERAWRASDKALINDVVSKWCSEDGAAAREKCLSHESEIKARLNEFLPVVPPRQGFQLFEWEPVGVLERVARGLSVHRSIVPDIFAALAKYWDDIHDAIDHQPRPEWDENDCSGSGISACTFASMCVCKGAGLEVQKFVDHFDAAVKLACPVGRIRTESLAHGYICVYVFAQRQPTDDDEDIDVATNGLVERLPIVDDMWLHIGSHSLSPWRSCFQTLRGPTGPTHPSIGVSIHRLEATVQFATPWQAFKDFDRDLRWSVCVYHMDVRVSPIGTFVPNCVDVHLLEDDEQPGVPTCRVIWKPPWAKWRKKQIKHPKKDADVKSGWHSIEPIENVKQDCDEDHKSDEDDGDEQPDHGRELPGGDAVAGSVGDAGGGSASGMDAEDGEPGPPLGPAE
ncbi:unnamed protein product, partial [Prorocentrum cordatum]